MGTLTLFPEGKGKLRHTGLVRGSRHPKALAVSHKIPARMGQGLGGVGSAVGGPQLSPAFGILSLAFGILSLAIGITTARGAPGAPWHRAWRCSPQEGGKGLGAGVLVFFWGPGADQGAGSMVWGAKIWMLA